MVGEICPVGWHQRGLAVRREYGFSRKERGIHPTDFTPSGLRPPPPCTGEVSGVGNLISGRVKRPPDCPRAAEDSGGAHATQHTAQASRKPGCQRLQLPSRDLLPSDPTTVSPFHRQRQRWTAFPTRREADPTTVSALCPRRPGQTSQHCEKIQAFDI